MLERFFPDEQVKSAYVIDYEKLYADGYRGILLDIDNTLVPHGAPADERALALFHRLKRIGYRTVLLSNNKEPRVKSFGDQVGARYIYEAGKPGTEGYERAMEMMGTDTSNTFFVGDQLFTDVWGAKSAGIRNFLVEPIHPKEEIQVVLKRYAEKVVLFFYRRHIGKQRDRK